ncbi:MAG: 3-oxoacyl-ACP reductase FabG [Myxococcota bacterium]|nr:3-oxoacyl-ACP reductase FabG [Myxococcota bacterium]
MESKGLAVVTGGSRGIGRATAIGLARDGYDIALSYRANRDKAQEVVDAVTELGRDAWAFEMELGSTGSVSAFADAILALNRPIAGLVHNAGMTRDGLFVSMKEKAWTEVTQAHLNGFYALTRPLLRGMLKARHGRIVTIVSFVGEKGNAGQVNYAAAKAGLIGATKALALEVGSRGLTVNAVSPGFIETDMTADLDREKIVERIPFGRPGSAEEVASVVRFLIGDGASYVTGQVIGVSGGLST